MKTIVYTTEFYCKRCKAPSKINLYSDRSDFKLDDRIKKEVDYWGKHYHWVHNHQICAICGKFVETGKGELDLIQTETMTQPINELYVEWDPNPDRGLLTVHKACSEELFKSAN